MHSCALVSLWVVIGNMQFKLNVYLKTFPNMLISELWGQAEGGRRCQPLCRGGGWTAGTRSTLVLGGTEKLLMDKESERLIGWEKKPFVCVAGEVGDAVLEDVCTRVEA